MLEQVYQDRSLLNRLARAAQETAHTRFPLSIQAERTLAFYEALLAQ